MKTMKQKFFFAAALVALASCSNDNYVGDNSPTMGGESGNGGAIAFGLKMQNPTRAGEYIGATAAEKLGGMFVVEGTKGTEATDAPSSTVVFDNYLVGYTANTAGVTESNTHNWEYVGLQNGITNRMTAATWTALHTVTAPETAAQAQTVKYWDYSEAQYDFIAWSTGNLLAVTTAPTANTSVQVTRINTGATLATNGFTLTAASAADLSKCYYTDINTVKKGDNYGKPVTLTFKNMSSKIRIALYETVPGYSVKNVYFYTSDDNPTAPTDLGNATTSTASTATLFTMGDDAIPQSGSVLVYYPYIGTDKKTNPGYNKASVTVTPGTGTGATSKTQGFSTLNYTDKESSSTYEPSGNYYLGRTLPAATYAGAASDNYYQTVMPNSNGKPLTLRVDYTLISTDGSGEEIHIYGAKAVVPATYTIWQPNYAYTYIFKISDNSNGWTSQTASDPKGLFPITFDAMIANFTDANAEQTTITTVATPSITTYQQGHNHANKDEYSKSQKAGADQDNVKDLYVQVMDNSTATSALVTDLNGTNKSLLFKITKGSDDYVASEAEVMDALQNRTSDWDSSNPVANLTGRNGITLTTNSNISNTETSIVNGVDDQPITKIAGTAIAAGQVAKIDIDNAGVTTGTYAYVYCTTVPSTNEKIYQVATVSGSTNEEKNVDAQKYYEVIPSSIVTETSTDHKAVAGMVYFVKNADNSYTFKQTKVGDDVTGLYEATIPNSKATSYAATNFYFDVYNQNNGKYAVKVIKVVN